MDVTSTPGNAQARQIGFVNNLIPYQEESVFPASYLKFTDEEQAEIDALLPLVGSEHIHLDGREATLDENCAIDLGGIAKGFASDKAADILSRSGADRACANLGGNVYVYSREGHDAWNVAIQDPQGKDDYVCILSLTDHFVVTSGGYLRYFVDGDGNRWTHIIDPSDGFPVENGLLSATVICENGTYADALSTALCVMGEDDAKKFYKNNSGFEIILITDDQRIVVSEGVRDSFTLSNNDYSVESLSRR